MSGNFPFFLPARRQVASLGAALVAPILSLSLAWAPSVYAQSPAVQQGYTLLSQNRVGEAINAFQAILRSNPRDVDALLGLGIAYRRAGRDADAFATYQKILELDPNNRLALSTLGYLGEFKPEWQPIGISALTRLLGLEPNNPDARAQRAKLYYYQGQFSQALADYAQVLPQTQDPEVLGTAAEAYTYSGDYTTGLNLFSRYRAVGGRIQGDRVIAYAQALRESGNVDQAVQVLQDELRRLPDFNPQNIRLRGALAAAYAANGQYQSAIDLVQSLRGRSDARLTLARALNAIGEYSQQTGYSQEAAQLYQSVLTEPNTPLGVRREAITVFSNVPELRPYALQLTQQLAQEVPGDASLAFLQQVLAYQTGQLSRPAFVQQVQSTFPVLPADSAQLRAIGQILTRLDPPLVELLPLYQSLLSAGSTESFLNFRLAQLFIQQGRLAEAKSALAAYAGTPSGNRNADTIQLLLADVNRREGSLNESVQRYQALIANSRSSQIRQGALQGLASVYQSQGQYGEAIALYDQLIAANPQDFSYVLGRTNLAYQAKLISEADATAVLNQALQRYGTNNAPSELIALVTALPADPTRANLYQTLLATNPDNVGLRLRSLQVLAGINPIQAKAEVARLIAQNPTNFDLYFIQGEIAQQTRDIALARQSYATILQLQPTNLDAVLALAGLEFQTGNLTQAEILYNQALALNSQSSAARTSLAALNAVQGRSLKAIRDLKAWQQAQGRTDPQIANQVQQLEEGLLQQRGIQPPWERF